MTNNYSKRNILPGIHLLAGYKEPLCFAEKQQMAFLLSPRQNCRIPDWFIGAMS